MDSMSATDLHASMDPVVSGKTIANSKKALMEIKRPLHVAMLRDRVAVLESDLARLANMIRTGSKGPLPIQGSTALPPADSDVLEGNKPEDRVTLGGTAKYKSDSANKRNFEQSNEGTAEMIYLSSDNFGVQQPKLKMRYCRRYANSLPMKLGSELIKDLPDFQKKQVSVPRLQHYGWNMSGVHYIRPRYIPLPVALIDEATGREYLSYFFDNINPLYSILHKPMFLQQFDLYLLTPYKPECRLFLAIFHAVCAIVVRYKEICENAKIEPELEEKLFDDAYSTLKAFSFEWESVEVVQGFLLLATYLRACHRQSSAWSVLGTAIRMALGMGLNHKVHQGTNLTDYELLKRQRVFWACFVLDRTFCIDIGRHFSLRENDMSIPIPKGYVDDGWQTQISSALVQFCLRLCDLVYDRDLNLNSSELKVIKSRLLSWNDSLEDIGLNSDTELNRFESLPAALVAHFRLCYYCTLFFIHMKIVFGLIGVDGHSQLIDRNLYVQCVKGVTNVASALNDIGQLKTPWWLTLYSLHYAGCIALLLIFHQTEVDEMGEELEKIIALLTIIADDGRFIMAKECVWSLKTLNHMVHMRFSQTLDILRSIGLDHGSSLVNKGNFSAMGYLDRMGNEVLFVGNPDSTPEASSTTPTSNATPLSSLNDQSSATTAPSDSAELSAFHNTLPGGYDPTMSLMWFDNWDWDMDNTIDDYFANPLGIDDDNDGL